MIRRIKIAPVLLLPILCTVSLPAFGQGLKDETLAIKIIHPDGNDAKAFVRSRHVAVGRVGDIEVKDGVMVCGIHHPQFNFEYSGAFVETFKVIKPQDDQILEGFKKRSHVLLIKSMEKPDHWQVAGLEGLSPKEPKQGEPGGWLSASFRDESMNDGLLHRPEYRYEGFVDDNLEQLKSEDPEVRRRSLYLLGVMEPGDAGANQVIDKLAEFMNAKESSDRTEAIRAIGRIGGQHAERYVPRIAELLGSDDPHDQYAAIDAICKIGGREAQKHIPRITGLMRIKTGLAHDIVHRLGEMGDQAASALPALLDGLKAVDKNDRTNVEVIIMALGKIGPTDQRVIDALTPLLDHENQDVRRISKRALDGRCSE